MLLGRVADAHRHQVTAFGDDARRGHRRLVVLERNREVGRVHDHEVGRRHPAQHALAGHRAHLGAHLGLHLGVAVDLFALLLGLLGRHAQAAQEHAPLQRHVDEGEDGQGQQHQRRAAAQQAAGLGERRRQRQGDEAGEGGQFSAQVLPADAADDGAEQADLDRLDELLGLEQSRDAGERIDLAEVGLERLEREVPAPREHRRRHRDEREQGAERQHRDEPAQHAGLEVRAHRARAGEAGGVEAQAVGEQAREPGEQFGRERGDERAAEPQRGQVAEVARARNLAFGARFLDLARGSR